MKRYKTIDFARGLCIMGMVFLHLNNWWLTPEDFWLYLTLEAYIGFIGASGFLFISGFSAKVAYKNWTIRIDDSNKFNIKMVRNVYLLRALFLLIIALIYNTIIAFALNDPTWIWAWNVLQTISFSLFMAWPLLKTSKVFRAIFGIFLLLADHFIFIFLLPYKGQANYYGILFHILYHPPEQYRILSYFTMFLIGTVIGDIVYDLNTIENWNERKFAFKNYILSSIIIGLTITIFGILFLFPSFLLRATLSSMLYSLGIIIIIVSVLIGIEEFEVFKVKKSYRCFYYYHYYSFTIYLAHNPLYFLFYRQLNVFTIWIPVLVTIFCFTLLVRVIYKKLGPKASLKVGITVLSFILATIIEGKKMSKGGKIKPLFNLGKSYFKKMGHERKD